MDLEKEIERLQEKIENAQSPTAKSLLLLQKIDLLKNLQAQKSIRELLDEKYKKIIEQLEWDIKNEGTP